MSLDPRFPPTDTTNEDLWEDDPDDLWGRDDWYFEDWDDEEEDTEDE